MPRKLFVTTALPYANGPFHIGHIMEYVQADIWVRFQRLQGHKVHFVCADDTHGTPIMLAAEKAGTTPEAFIAGIQAGHERDFADFGVAFDHYDSTHSPRNRALTEAIHYFKTNKQSSLNIIQQYTRVQDPKILEETYRVYALRYLPKAPYATANGVKTILESLIENQPGVKTAKPEEFIDASFVQELDKMGWIERIYR